ncbi:MAG: 16S rRNA (cytosine(967)-C(5))-methyltransferase RsmB [Clostridia bacterium]|nr:16S rRNA (cytosine(967)-C(5))-methyltransferase RsmB [Clostridia bacterium]
MTNARQIAFEALLKTFKEDSYSNLTLDRFLSKTNIDTRDKSFVSALFYGTIERKLTIDYQLSKYLSKPLKKLKPEVLIILETGAYQILFMDKVPDSAAVNESVKLAKKNGLSFAGGLINAVLRKVASNGILLPDEKDKVNYLSIKYSCPMEYIELWFNELGEEDTVALLESTIGEADIIIRVNTCKCTPERLMEILESEGIEVSKTYVDNALSLNLCGKDIETLSSFKEGLFHVQDLSCQICCSALGAKEGDTVFDLCSAPGGKAFTVAQHMNNSGTIKCFDLYKSRVELIKKGADRLGLSCVTADVSDASVFNDKIGFADRVLCDVPCSGLGIIRRKPEIKYKSLESLSGLPEIQYNILCNAAKYVKPSGTLVYSTCTLLKQENEDVCRRFLKENDEYYSVAPAPDMSENKFLTLLPHKNNGDGFFIAAFRRKD